MFKYLLTFNSMGDDEKKNLEAIHQQLSTQGSLTTIVIPSVTGFELFARNMLIGIGRSIGFIVGTSILVPIAIKLLTLVFGTIDIPILADFVNELLQHIQMPHK